VAEAQTGAAAARRRTRMLQRYLLNPPVKLAVMLGMSPRHMLVETRGRKTGKRRRNVVGYTGGGDTLWVVAEQGRHAGYVAATHCRRGWIDASPSHFGPQRLGSATTQPQCATT
jgi:hypothetical protein